MRIKTRVITQFAMLTAVALILGWVEHMIPLPGIPGLKLGLGNIVVLYAMYLMNNKSAAILMLLKVLLSGLFFGASLWTMLISLSGGICSFLIMALVKLAPRISIMIVSMSGAIFHIVGQLLVIILAKMTPWSFLLLYMPILGAASIGTGLLTGLVAMYALKAMNAYHHTGKSGPPEKKEPRKEGTPQ